jgi:hypothetical protein
MIYDAVVIGGGFYGVKIALALHNIGLNVVIVEPNGLLTGATTVNQARVHHGYHYPRFFATAASAAKHYRRFITDYAGVIVPNKQHLYAIAQGSKTTPEEFEGVCAEIGAPLAPISTPYFFNKWLVEKVYRVQEVSFDINKITAMLDTQLSAAGIPVIQARGEILGVQNEQIDLVLHHMSMETSYLQASYVFNCTYANLDTVVDLRTRLKKEWTEVAICSVPPILHDTDITIMDGLFWSLMKYPPSGEHALTHVKYTPHVEWFSGFPAPIYPRYDSWFSKMQEDACRFVPLMEKANYIRSLWTTRVVLAQNEENDGRPILWEYAKESPRIISVLGSKFNSIYDAIAEIERGEWMRPAAKTGVMRIGRRALVGYTGFVGANLVSPGRFTDYSNTKQPLPPGHYEQIVCTALKGTKWWANVHPEEDYAMLGRLKEMLRHCTTDEFILISTIDALPYEVVQTSYGKHRRWFEEWVKKTYLNVRIIRLPALFGPGLKKNVLFDLLHAEDGRPLEINPASTYQWYNVEHLWNDIQMVRKYNVSDYNLVTPPIPMSWLLDNFFPNVPVTPGSLVTYDIGPYMGLSDEEVVLAYAVKDELEAFIRKEQACLSQS